MFNKYLIFVLSLLLALAFFGCTKKPSGDAALYVDKKFTFPAGFPADPGEAGKKGLDGVDSDHDGLRDDVQRWIYARYPSDEVKRKSLRQVALFYQATLKPAPNEADQKNILDKTDKAIACLSRVFPGIVEPTIEMEYVRAKMLNTLERTRQFLNTDRLFDGKFLGGGYMDRGTACE